MGVAPICPLEQGCPFIPMRLGEHEDGCPFDTSSTGPRTWVSSTGPRTSVSSTGPEHGCPQRDPEHGCPQRDPNMGVLSANKCGCPLDAEDGCPFRTLRRWVSFPHPHRDLTWVSQRSTNMGVPWHPSLRVVLLSGRVSMAASHLPAAPGRRERLMAREGDGHYSGGP